MLEVIESWCKRFVMGKLRADFCYQHVESRFLTPFQLLFRPSRSYHGIVSRDDEQEKERNMDNDWRWNN